MGWTVGLEEDGGSYTASFLDLWLKIQTESTVSKNCSITKQLHTDKELQADCYLEKQLKILSCGQLIGSELLQPQPTTPGVCRSDRIISHGLFRPDNLVALHLFQWRSNQYRKATKHEDQIHIFPPGVLLSYKCFSTALHTKVSNTVHALRIQKSSVFRARNITFYLSHFSVLNLPCGWGLRYRERMLQRFQASTPFTLSQ